MYAQWNNAIGSGPIHSTPSCRNALIIRIASLWLAFGMSATLALAQAGGHKLFGDLRVDESKSVGTPPLSYDILLYSRSGNMLQRVSIPNRGRYQFLNLADGEYFVVVEVENREIARVFASVFSPFRTDFRKDIELEWRSNEAQSR